MRSSLFRAGMHAGIFLYMPRVDIVKKIAQHFILEMNHIERALLAFFECHNIPP